MRIVPAGNVVPARWRNGGGWTRELCAWPAPADWIVRVSVADVEADGPFSAFPGVDRWFAVLDGDGVALAHDGGPAVRLTPQDAIHRFDGEAPTDCRLLGGATRDFNVMARRDRARASVRAIDAAPAATAAVPDWSACFAVAPLRVRAVGDAWRALAARTLAWASAPARLEVEAAPGTRGWRIDVHAKAHRR
ncbi:MAG: hypothetical protein BroJett026_31210 [Betaproteobacteria bacterium]|nr:MAG: hypothetical protein BroJett026_31210 [Betaproteobacteria bacterium]